MEMSKVALNGGDRLKVQILSQTTESRPKAGQDC